MSRPELIGSALVVALLAVAGCGGSAQHTTGSAAATGAVFGAGAKTFSAPGMALHFSFPASLRVMRLAPSKRIAGNTARASHAAVGVGVYDLLVVTRYPNRPLRERGPNILSLKSLFDDAVSAAVGRRISSVSHTIGKLPALSYPSAPARGLPVSATNRITIVFVGSDEYELDCQYTPGRAPTMVAACDQMLATLRTGA